MKSKLKILLFSCSVFYPFHAAFSQGYNCRLDIPDQLIVEAYEKAANQNVLAAVNSKIFFGYFSVCADGKGFGYGNSYPSLDGHQMSDALLWLGQIDVVKANWEYVKKFQKQNGALSLAIWRPIIREALVIHLIQRIQKLRKLSFLFALVFRFGLPKNAAKRFSICLPSTKALLMRLSFLHRTQTPRFLSIFTVNELKIYQTNKYQV
jgi:hypothetical protein